MDLVTGCCQWPSKVHTGQKVAHALYSLHTSNVFLSIFPGWQPLLLVCECCCCPAFQLHVFSDHIESLPFPRFNYKSLGKRTWLQSCVTASCWPHLIGPETNRVSPERSGTWIYSISLSCFLLDIGTRTRNSWL